MWDIPRIKGEGVQMSWSEVRTCIKTQWKLQNRSPPWVAQDFSQNRVFDHRHCTAWSWHSGHKNRPILVRFSSVVRLSSGNGPSPCPVQDADTAGVESVPTGNTQFTQPVASMALSCLQVFRQWPDFCFLFSKVGILMASSQNSCKNSIWREYDILNAW